jgi:hypothetical protein
MSEHERTAPELKAFEALLAGLEPAVPALDHDRLMYEAGRASIDAVARASADAVAADAVGRRGWPVATLCVGLVALMVGRWTALSGPAANVAGGRPPAIGSAAVPNEVVAPADSWAHLRTSLVEGDVAVAKSADSSDVPQGPRAATETWLQERRQLLNSLN